MLADIAGMTAGPQLYDGNANPLAIMGRRVEPVFHGVLFVVAAVVKAFPAAPEQTADQSPSRPERGRFGGRADAAAAVEGVKEALLELCPVKKGPEPHDAMRSGSEMRRISRYRVLPWRRCYR